MIWGYLFLYRGWYHATVIKALINKNIELKERVLSFSHERIRCVFSFVEQNCKDDVHYSAVVEFYLLHMLIQNLEEEWWQSELKYQKLL